MRAGDVLDRAAWLMSDADHGRIGQALWLKFLSDAQRQLALLRPDATARRALVQLVPGTLQAIPADGLRLLEATRTMEGATPGQALRLVDRASLDAFDPAWHVAAPAAPHSYAFDPRTPRIFHVSPPAPASPPAAVEMVYSAAPAELATVNDALAVDDVYAAALLDYILHLAFAMDTDSEASRSRSAAHLAAFHAAVGGKLQSDLLVTPNAGGRS